MRCEQCGEVFEIGDVVMTTCFHHNIHDYCVGDYLSDLEDSFEPSIYEGDE